MFRTRRSDTGGRPRTAVRPATNLDRRSLSRLPGSREIAVRGSLDVSNAAEMRTAIIDSILRRCQRLYLDLSRVTFLDSTGLRVLARANKLCRLEGVDLRLVRPSVAVRRVLDITLLTPVFNIVEHI